MSRYLWVASNIRWLSSHKREEKSFWRVVQCIRVLCCSLCFSQYRLCSCAVHGLMPEQHCPRHWKGCLVPGFPDNIQMRPVTQHSCYQTVRKSGIWLHRLMRLWIYSVGTFENIFHLSCLQLAFYDLVPERRSGFHSKCIVSKSWSTRHTFFSVLDTENGTKFWFIHAWNKE